MPWECAECKTEVPDDGPVCPSCASPKTSWTMVGDKTRTFVVSRKRVELLVAEGDHLTAARYATHPGHASPSVASAHSPSPSPSSSVPSQ